MYHVMGGGNMDIGHDHIYVHYTLVATQCCLSGTFTTILKQLSHVTTMSLLKKSNMVDYICMYDVYKLTYIIPIFDSLANIIQLTNFLTW